GVGGAVRGIDVERGKKQRLDQPGIKNALAGDDFADAFVRPAPQQPRHGEIIQRMGAWYAPFGIENPKRQTSVVKAQRPARAAVEIEKRKFGFGRTDQAVLRTDRAQKIECRMIAGE